MTMAFERSKMLDKVRALLAKTISNGCTEAEAFAALAKARALIDAWEISDEELELTREEKAILRADKGSDRHSIKLYLAPSVARFCGVRIWTRGGPKGGFEFCGLPADVDLAQWLLDHLRQFVLVELAEFLCSDIRPRGHRRRVINGFALGCTGRIAERLDELTRQSQAAAKASASGGRALVLANIKAEAIAAFIDGAGFKVSRGRPLHRVSDHDSKTAGRAAGERATFGRPVEGSPSTPRLR
jgi:hypothetical protein